MLTKAYTRYQALGVKLELMATDISCTRCRALVTTLEVAAFPNSSPRGLLGCWCLPCLRTILTDDDAYRKATAATAPNPCALCGVRGLVTDSKGKQPCECVATLDDEEPSCKT